VKVRASPPRHDEECVANSPRAAAVREVDLRLVAGLGLVAHHRLCCLRWRGPETPHIGPELRDPALVAGRSTLAEEARPAEAGILRESCFDDPLECFELRRHGQARTIPRTDRVERLVEEPLLDPAVHRRPADAGPSDGLGAIAGRLV
jgi:hypothetical protein